MEKEKIVLGNSTEVPYDSLSIGNDRMVISFIGGDMAELEQIFRSAGQTNLESIKQLDAAGGEQAVHERYDIFSAINKKIATDAANDVVEVVMIQESEIDMKIRHLEERTSSVEEVTDTLLMSELA